ncbi:hypothetical protein L9F63_026941, partial [Diploptera punctata]
SKECNLLHSQCTSVMEDILFSMSLNSLDIKYLWPGGLETFRQHLHKGILLLPPDYTKWLDVLCDRHTSDSTQYALIILSFFSCLCAS